MFAISLYRQAFTILAKDTYDLTSQHFGYLLSAVAVLGVLANTVVIRLLAGRFNQYTIVRHGLLLLALSFLCLSLFPSSLTALLAFTAPITLLGSLLSTQLTASTHRRLVCQRGGRGAGSGPVGRPGQPRGRPSSGGLAAGRQ